MLFKVAKCICHWEVGRYCGMPAMWGFRRCHLVYSHQYSPGSYWSSSHWRAAYKFEIIGGHPPIYGDFCEHFINTLDGSLPISNQTNH